MPPEEIEQIRDNNPQKYAELEEIARAHVAEATMLALTPTQPYYSPIPRPTDTPGFTPTPEMVMGMLFTCESAGHSEFVLRDCWRGSFNGQIITLGAGIRRLATHTDLTDGWIVIYRGPYFRGSDPNPAIYEAPYSVGIVGLQSVDNNKLTLIPTDFYGYPKPNAQPVYFDLVTRQFQTASGTPIPTTPVP